MTEKEKEEEEAEKSGSNFESNRDRFFFVRRNISEVRALFILKTKTHFKQTETQSSISDVYIWKE